MRPQGTVDPLASSGRQRLSLPQVTLCAVDARSPGLAPQSLQRSMAQVDFARVLLFTHGWSPATQPPGVELIDSGPVRSGAEYSRFVLRELPGYVQTSHVLVSQWDGFVVDAGAWRPEFLDCDYIGASWPEQPDATAVGNGGFSLRSQKLLQAGLDAHIEQVHPEDQVLCREHRVWLEQRHGIRFAPRELARNFAYENETPRQATFGFHGPRNLPRVLDQATLTAWLAELPDAFFRSRDARRLARSLLAHRMPDAASALLQRRQEAGRRDPQTRMLAWAASMARRLPGLKSKVSSAV